MLCPRCRAALAPQDYGGTQIETCERCGGCVVETEDLKVILENVSLQPEGPVTRTPVDLTGVEEDAGCPNCGVAMEPFNYAGDSGVIIDRCGQCGRLWLDAGDLERILKVVAASDQDLDRDIKRFSADLHEAAVRQDALEQTDSRTARDPVVGAIAARLADADNNP